MVIRDIHQLAAWCTSHLFDHRRIAPPRSLLTSIIGLANAQGLALGDDWTPVLDEVAVIFCFGRAFAPALDELPRQPT